MELADRAKKYLAGELERFSKELAEKYGVPEDEVKGIVSDFLEQTYGPALKLVNSISQADLPAILFISRENCTICQECRPKLEKFLENHNDVQLFKVDYSGQQGLLYHMIQQGDKGLLPMIALIFKGCIRMMYTGECVHPDVYEEYYNSLKAECSQNIYAL